MFAIGIREKNTQLERGVCDVFFVGPDTTLTIQQVSEVVSLTEEVFFTPGQKPIVHDFLYDLAGITGKSTTIEKDVYLQHVGLDDMNLADATLVFIKNVGNKFYYGEKCSANDVHQFLFS